MIAFLFFVSVFSSITWAAYMGLYITSKLAGNDLSSLAVSDVALYVGLIILPIWAVWQIFGLMSQHKTNTNMEKKIFQLFNQMKKNQDYTDLIVRVMLDAEHEIKDGFVVNKFDVFVADMNEILADIVQRCNAASSLQMEQLWSKVKNGERWAIAKRLIETSKTHSNFTTYLAEKSAKDDVFKGTLLEFCYRYQNLSALLEKHDRDRVFITILETGVMGKAYSILAPVVDVVDYSYNPESIVEEKNDTADITQHIMDMKEPERNEPQISVWKKLNPFKNVKAKENATMAEEENQDDDFFAALEKSMNTPEQKLQKYNDDEKCEDYPRFGLSMENNKEDEVSSRLDISITDEKQEPYIGIEPETKTEIKEDNNFAYPFGGWVNEDNYKK